MRVALLLFVFCSAASALEIAEIEIPDSVALDSGGAPLALNGAGVRTKFFVKVYVGALYLPVPAHSAEEVLAQPGPKRVAMHFLYSKVERDKLVDGWLDGFRDNNDAATMQALAPRLEQFNALFDDVQRGDVIALDYVPGTGTRVSIRGEIKGAIAGEDFNRALLNVWLGPNPPNAKLKSAMLGGH